MKSDIRSFTFHGKVRGQGRPRATTRGWKTKKDGKPSPIPTIYKAETDRQYEALIREAYNADWDGLEPLQGAFALDIVVYVPMAKSLSKAKRKAMKDTFCQSKPDLDNVQKAILDALNGVAFVDDKNCVAITAQKYWSEQGRIDIRLTDMEGEPNE